MHRLTVLEHDIVCDVYDIVNRANAVCAKSLTQPKRRRLDFNVGDDSVHIPRAELCVLNLGFKHSVNIAVIIIIYNGSMQIQRLIECCGSLSCKTDNR